MEQLFFPQDISESDEKQILVENAAMPDIAEAEETTECQQQILENIIQDERSSSFPFAAVQSDSNPDTNSQQPESSESMNNFLANLVEENANSLPPVIFILNFFEVKAFKYLI